MSIQRLDARHVDEAAATLGEAFFDDPLLQVVAPGEATRRRWGDWFMSLTVQYGLRWGEVWCTDDMSAVAVWVPPDSGEMSLGPHAPYRPGQDAAASGDVGYPSVHAGDVVDGAVPQVRQRPALVSRRNRRADRLPVAGTWGRRSWRSAHRVPSWRVADELLDRLAHEQLGITAR